MHEVRCTEATFSLICATVMSDEEKIEKLRELAERMLGVRVIQIEFLYGMPGSVHCQSIDFYQASENRMRIRVRVEGDPYPRKAQTELGLGLFK